MILVCEAGKVVLMVVFEQGHAALKTLYLPKDMIDAVDYVTSIVVHVDQVDQVDHLSRSFRPCLVSSSAV